MKILVHMYLLCSGLSCSDVTTTVACALPHKEDYATDDLRGPYGASHKDSLLLPGKLPDSSGTLFPE